MTAARLLLPLSIALAGLGCAPGVYTSIHASADSTRDGVSYFLPTNNVRVVFTNGTIPSEIKAAEALVKSAKDTEGTAKKNFEQIKKKLEAAKPEEREHLEKAVEEAKAAVDRASAAVTKAEDDLKKVQEARKQILVEVLPPIADTSQVYVARLEHCCLYEDKLTLKTSAEGFLTQITYRGEDQTGEIIHNLVETAIEAAKLYARLQGFPIGPSKTDDAAVKALTTECDLVADPKKEFYWEFTIDPSNTNDVAAVNRQLIETPLPYLVSIVRPEKTFNLPAAKTSDVQGFYYRRPVPYVIRIHEDEQAKEALCELVEADSKTEAIPKILAFMETNAYRIPTSKSQQVAMAAGGPVTWLKIDARPFVTTEIAATLSNGLLLETTETRPSEVLGASLIPLDIVRTVGNAVGEIIDNVLPVKLEWTNKSTELVEAETALLKAQKANADLQKQLAESLAPGDLQPAP